MGNVTLSDIQTGQIWWVDIPTLKRFNKQNPVSNTNQLRIFLRCIIVDILGKTNPEHDTLIRVLPLYNNMTASQNHAVIPLKALSRPYTPNDHSTPFPLQ